MRTLKILVTGGGTSGHISPALAVVQTLRGIAAEPAAQWQPLFLYVGGKNGPEQALAAAEGVPFVGVATGKLRRYFSWRNFSDALRIPLGVIQALQAVRSFKPDVVLATGGYVAVPPVLAAKLLGVPVLIHEQTTQVGLANRIAARCATRIALSWPSALQELAPSQQRRAWVSGNPVRPLILNGDVAAGARYAGFDEAADTLPTLYITGGSQGARVINRAVEEALPQLLEMCRIIHQCGTQPSGTEQDFDRLQGAASALPPELRKCYFVTRFIGPEIGDVLAWCDAVVGRAGAGTVSELCAVGKPALYIPLVPTGGDEQTRNAAMCQQAGAALVLTQRDCDGAHLLEAVSRLLADREQLHDMAAAATSLARPQAARDLAQCVLELAGAR